MCEESLKILQEMFAEDISVPANFDADQLRRDHSLNIATNILLAIKTQPRQHGAKSEQGETEIMAKKTGAKKEGKFAFIKEHIKEGKLTFDEIVAAVTEKFPHWDAKLVKCGVFSSRTQLRKAGDDTSNWLAAPETATAATEIKCYAEMPDEAEKPHITQPTAHVHAD